MKNSILLILFFSPIFVFSQNNSDLIPFKKGDSWGFATKDGTLKINAAYDKVSFFRNGKAMVWKDENQGFIDSQGENLVELIYRRTSPIYFDERFFIALKGNKSGVVNSEKKVVLTFQFDKIEAWGNTFLRVKKDNLFGFYKLVDGQFVEFLPLRYTNIEMDRYSGKYFFKGITKNGDIEYLDKGGRLLERVTQKDKNNRYEYEIEDEAVEMPPPADDYIKYPQFKHFKDNGKAGLIVTRRSNSIHSYRKILTDTLVGNFQEIITKHSFSDAYVVKENGKWGAVNLKGKTIIESEYDSIDIKTMKFQGQSGQTFIVQKNGKWGVIGNANKFRQVMFSNKVRIPFEYDAIRRNVNHTYYIVAKNERFGVVDAKNFNLIVQPNYRNIKNTFKLLDNFALFIVTLDNGEDAFVGENGVEFFSN